MSEFTGKLIVKTETKEYGSKGFKKRTFVVESEDKYPQKIEFELVKDKCSLIDEIEEGDMVKLSYNLRGREWESPEGDIRYFNTLQAWKVELEF
jgi:hypothetical protein